MKSNGILGAIGLEMHDDVKPKKAPPSSVLCFAAPISAGKTTVSTKVAEQLAAPRASFGDYLRGVARNRGLEITREVLQDLGDKLVSRGVRRFCEDMLEQQPWIPGRPLIIDGVRHIEVLDSLGEILTPAKTYLIYINVDRTTQARRLTTDPLHHEKSLEELEKHPTEQQVKSKLPDRTALFIDGTQDPDKSTRLVIEFLKSKEPET